MHGQMARWTCQKDDLHFNHLPYTCMLSKVCLFKAHQSEITAAML